MAPYSQAWPTPEVVGDFRDSKHGTSSRRSWSDRDDEEGNEGRSRHGFASMDPEEPKRIARTGGRASHDGGGGSFYDGVDRWQSRRGPVAMGLESKVKNALDEARTLVLVAQVLIGFEFQSAFSRGFDRLPQSSKTLRLGAALCLLASLAFLVAPVAFHRIALRGAVAAPLLRRTTTMVGAALVPFAIGLGLDAYVVSEKTAGTVPAVVIGGGICVLAAFLWFGLSVVVRRARAAQAGGHGRSNDETPRRAPLADRVSEVLTEARVVLPGAQAMLGFQLATFLMDGFDALPRSSQWLHLASLLVIALSTMFLMAIPAYHRLVLGGEDSEELVRVASGFLITAMLLLPIGLCGDLFVVVRKIASLQAAWIASGAALSAFYGLWLGGAWRRPSMGLWLGGSWRRRASRR